MRASFEPEKAGTYGFQTSPLFTELLDRLRRESPLHPTHAKRHHFIPQFMLRGFTSDEKLFQLDSETGQVHPVSVDTAASRRWFYRFEHENGQLDTSMEAFLEIVESHSATAMKNLLNPLLPLADSDRATLAFFFALLDVRTPFARARTKAMQEQMMKLMAGSKLADVESFLSTDPPLNGEEPEEARLRILEEVANGTIGVPDQERRAMQMLLTTAGEIAGIVYAMDWFILTPESGDFVTSDRGLAMHDDNLRLPWSGHAWNSSATAETYIPISEGCCVVVSPGSGLTVRQPAPVKEVRDVNRMIYGFADKYVFGEPKTLGSLHSWASRHAERVPRPRPAYQSLLIYADPDDDSIAETHRKKGWPDQMLVTDDEGEEYVMDYLVIGLDGEALELGMGTNELVEKRHHLMSSEDAESLKRSSINAVRARERRFGIQ